MVYRKKYNIWVKVADEVGITNKMVAKHVRLLPFYLQYSDEGYLTSIYLVEILIAPSESVT
ncbi:Uncharacterised protein [Staphylococcus aureus]|nr:Uncharacterised protein [Staphylococcus aureus]